MAADNQTDTLIIQEWMLKDISEMERDQLIARMQPPALGYQVVLHPDEKGNYVEAYRYKLPGR
jgi:hypothetical protein